MKAIRQTILEAADQISLAATEPRPLHRFALLHLAHQAVTSARNDLRKQLDALDESAQAALLNAGATRGMRLDDPAVMVRTHGQLWASVDRRDGESVDDGYRRACAALRAAGLGQFPHERFDVRSLSAHFREARRDDPDYAPPAELDGAIRLAETFSVRVTRG